MAKIKGAENAPATVQVTVENKWRPFWSAIEEFGERQEVEPFKLVEKTTAAFLAYLCMRAWKGEIDCRARTALVGNKLDIPADALTHFKLIDPANEVFESPTGERIYRPEFAENGHDWKRKARQRVALETWLLEAMREAPNMDTAQKPEWYGGPLNFPRKVDWFEEARRKLGRLTRNSFDESWRFCLETAGAHWDRPGAPSAR
jgi:hypothetical protein